MKATRVVLLALALTAAACNNDSSSLTAPTNPPTITDGPFTGTVDVMGTGPAHNFVVSQPGDVQITLSQAGPPPTITEGLGVGSPTGTTCPLTVGQTKAAASLTPLDVGALAAGTYCVVIFDVGNQAGPITYSLTVTHP
jgi:hypothetical protein